MIAAAIFLVVVLVLAAVFEVRRRVYARRIERWASAFGIRRRPGESTDELHDRVVRWMRGIVDEPKPRLRSIPGGRR